MVHRSNHLIVYKNVNISLTGVFFYQECYCCRESFMRERFVTLTHCYDPDGMKLEQEGSSTMEIRMREPAECQCSKCGDFGR